MDMFGVLNVSSSAMYAQRARMNTIASNMANVNSTRTAEGGPYKRRDIVFASAPVVPGEENGLEGVVVSDVAIDQSQPARVFDPGHPDADKDGYVEMPNVNMIEEMANMIMASRAYEANVSAFNISKGMMLKTFDLGR